MPRVDDQDGYSWIQGSLSVSTGSSDELEIEDLIFGDKNSSSNPLTPLERDSISRLVDIFTDRSDEEPNDTDIPSEGVRRSIRNQRHQVDHEDLGSSLDVSREESVTVPDRDRRLGDECEASTTCPASTDSIVHPPSEVEPRNCHTSVSATKAVPHQDLRHRTPDHHNTTGRSSSNRRSTTAQPTGTAPLTSTPLNSINSTRNFQPPDKGEALSESSSRLRTESAVYSAPRKRFSLGGSGVQRRSLSNLTSRTSSSFKPAKDPTNAKEAIELVKIFLKEFPNQYSDQEALKLFKQCGGWSLMFEVASLRVLNNESDEGDRRYSEKVRSMIWTEEEDRLVLKLVEKIRSRRLEKKEGDRDSIKETVVEDDSESFSSADPGLIEELKLRKSEQAIKNRIEFLDNYLKHSNLF
ncbi:hypothetical protein BY996DRAFT_53513 [Phakopsora pachyrhizi]|nr:hypothetical protein BY996DRAFT_53513 [Phakopsora pachyrhizi]